MTVYGYNEEKNNFIESCLLYVLGKYNQKYEGQAIEYKDPWYYILKDIEFSEINKMMRAGSLCRILIFDENTNIDFIIEQEIAHFIEKNEDVEGGICYYLTNLDIQSPKAREKQQQLEQGLAEQMSDSFRREYWNLDCFYSLMRAFPEKMRGYTCYLSEKELQSAGISDIPIDLQEVLCRYLKRSFRGDRFSRMEQAGSVTDEKVTLQKVFIDLEADQENRNPDIDTGMFVKEMICQGNGENRKELRSAEGRIAYRKYLLLGTAGQGKSTVCQYLVQIYRAYFLKRYLKN